MAGLNSANVRSYGDTLCGVWTAKLGVAAPTDATTALPAGWYNVGGIDSAKGIELSQAMQQTKVYAMQGGVIARVLKSQVEKPFSFTALETNRIVKELQRPGSTLTSTGGTSEVQTVTISGTPTGGTFTLALAGYGTASGLAYNISPAALGTALDAAFGTTGTTVAGTAGQTYTVTFAAALGKLPTMTATSNLTGGTTPTISVAETTAGTGAINSRAVPGYTGMNLRQWVINLVDGGINSRIYVPNGEAVQDQNIVYNVGTATVFGFTVTPYPDSAGNLFYELDNNAALGTGEGWA